MATLKATRSAQTTLWSEFTFKIAADAMANTDGALTNFKATAGVFDVIGLPMNAVVVGGDVTVETVSDDSSTATISVGDADSDTRYASAVDMKTAALTALTLTGYRGVGKNLRITLANGAGDATTGKVTVRVGYIVTGRANEQHAPV